LHPFHHFILPLPVVVKHCGCITIPSLPEFTKATSGDESRLIGLKQSFYGHGQLFDMFGSVWLVHI